MTIRKLSPKTQQGYIRTIKNLAAFLGRSLDKASFEDVRRFQLHVAQSGVGTGALNATVAALWFFFRVTLKRSAIIEHTAFIHEPRKLPVVLSPRFLSHVLPQGFHRIRYYGLLASGARADNVARARELLAVPKAHNDTASTTCADASEPQTLSHPCPCCGGRMIVIETFERGGSPRYRPAASPIVIRIDTS